MTATLRVHAVEARSRANGPGVRGVVWVQGCDLGCPGCFNPETHAGGGDRHEVDALVARFASDETIEGVTISGGEPLQQPEGVLALVSGLRQRTALSILVFSGYTVDEIRAQPLGPAILDQLDVIVDGRYRSGERHAIAMRGSANQRIHCLTERYTVAEVEATPEAEIRIDPAGNIVMSGVAPLRVK